MEESFCFVYYVIDSEKDDFNYEKVSILEVDNCCNFGWSFCYCNLCDTASTFRALAVLSPYRKYKYIYMYERR